MNKINYLISRKAANRWILNAKRSQKFGNEHFTVHVGDYSHGRPGFVEQVSPFVLVQGGQQIVLISNEDPQHGGRHSDRQSTLPWCFETDRADTVKEGEASVDDLIVRAECISEEDYDNLWDAPYLEVWASEDDFESPFVVVSTGIRTFIFVVPNQTSELQQRLMEEATVLSQGRLGVPRGLITTPNLVDFDFNGRVAQTPEVLNYMDRE